MKNLDRNWRIGRTENGEWIVGFECRSWDEASMELSKLKEPHINRCALCKSTNLCEGYDWYSCRDCGHDTSP